MSSLFLVKVCLRGSWYTRGSFSCLEHAQEFAARLEAKYKRKFYQGKLVQVVCAF